MIHLHQVKFCPVEKKIAFDIYYCVWALILSILVTETF